MKRGLAAQSTGESISFWTATSLLDQIQGRKTFYAIRRYARRHNRARVPIRSPNVLRTTAAIRSQLFSFHSHVNKLSKVLIEDGDRHILSHGGGGDQAVDKVRGEGKEMVSETPPSPVIMLVLGFRRVRRGVEL